MNNWMIFALLSPAVYTVVNFIDKYLIEKEVKDYRGMPIYASIMGGVMGTIFWFTTGMHFLPYFDALLVLTSGILQIFGMALYFRAISKSETSQLIIFFQMLPIFILIFSYIFLEEIITMRQIIGFITLLVASIGLSFDKQNAKFELSSAFYLILAVDIIWALSAVLMKFTIHTSEFAHILTYESWGIALGGLILFLFVPVIRRSFISTQKQLHKKVLAVMFSNEGLFVLAKSLAFYAYLIGPVSLVSVVGGSVQVFFGIILGTVLTLFFPTIFKEDISRNNISKKIVFGAVICVGMWLVY